MSEGVRLLVAFGIALGASAVATPATIAIARRTAFYDHPTGYKRHPVATPCLGGMAVVLGLVAGSTALAPGGLEAVILVAVGLLCVGIVDDRVGLGIASRLVAQLGVAAALYYTGFGFSGLGGEAADLMLTAAFVVAVVNAYNLMDNLDGAAATVAATSAGVVGAYATAWGDPLVGVLAFALAGACAGFLPYNLARPRARVFLGDGGSMPIGVALAAMMMALPQAGDIGWELVPVMVVLVGLPALDTTLVIVSRLRRGVTVLSGGRDHLTHRLEAMLGSSRRVALALAGGQAVCSAIALALLQLDPAAAAAGAGALIVLGMAVIAALEAPRRLGLQLEGAGGALDVPGEALQVTTGALQPPGRVPAAAPQGESPA